MGTIPAEALLKQWTLQQLTHDRATGNILQHLVLLHETDNGAAISRTEIKVTLDRIEQNQTRLRDELDVVMRHLQLKPRSEDVRPTRRKRKSVKQSG